MIPTIRSRASGRWPGPTCATGSSTPSTTASCSWTGSSCRPSSTPRSCMSESSSFGVLIETVRALKASGVLRPELVEMDDFHLGVLLWSSRPRPHVAVRGEAEPAVGRSGGTRRRRLRPHPQRRPEALIRAGGREPEPVALGIPHAVLAEPVVLVGGRASRSGRRPPSPSRSARRRPGCGPRARRGTSAAGTGSPCWWSGDTVWSQMVWSPSVTSPWTTVPSSRRWSPPEVNPNTSTR